ncbi:hypothetical protein AC579_4637 [Pseudocercospora musae]|uniref:Uncharacterized protein n=1 Tax=Pseudocercospora musae TaxID=113226 RepID=A0A139IBN6_9PEZI|nr:hypothetical protein AC579_4637 [Pseudocercospora musae]
MGSASLGMGLDDVDLVLAGARSWAERRQQLLHRRKVASTNGWSVPKTGIRTRPPYERPGAELGSQMLGLAEPSAMREPNGVVGYIRTDGDKTDHARMGSEPGIRSLYGLPCHIP